MAEEETGPIIDEKAAGQVRELLKKRLPEPVRLVYFTQEPACGNCREQLRLLKALASLSPMLSLEAHDLMADADLARRYGIDKVPGTAVVGSRDYGMRFFGVTGGYEFASLLEAVVIAGSGSSGLIPELEELVQLIDVPTHVEVLVTLTCPYCPQMVHLAHQMAVANDLVRADMVNAADFPPLVQRYEVKGVPRTVINERPAFEGALPPEEAILEVLKAVKPDLYEQIEAARREVQGERQAREATPGELYDVIVVGAGPAALSAAVYAARKALSVAILGDRIGGQVADTASVENWLGIPEVGGQDLAAAFRAHAERYPLAVGLHLRVDAVARDEDGFRVRAADGKAYRGRTVVYCAGKEYRRLGVPGESRFIGRGIGFCATCDAPLYRDRRVAVIGGGNSAFTAARDLLHYAREIAIVNITEGFQADPVLREQVQAHPAVRLYPATRVREFLGQESLSGVRLEAVNGEKRFDLAVEGVFLEIGLVPNSGPVQDLLPLNEAGEVPVGRDQSTSVPGFFAAGDVTDEPEKQIVVAAGAGAKAALAASAYLEERVLALLEQP